MEKNIDDLLVKIYGNEKAAQEALSVGRTAIANWRKWGQFPREKALTIALDARERGLRIRLEDIPILPRK